VIVLELAVGGDLGGKDLVNMIKATMDWVDIDRALDPRADLNQKKPQIHGADEVVSEVPGSRGARGARESRSSGADARAAAPGARVGLAPPRAHPGGAGVAFRVVVSNVDESLQAGEDGAAGVERLARDKACRGARRGAARAGADTEVVCDGACSASRPGPGVGRHAAGPGRAHARVVTGLCW